MPPMLVPPIKALRVSAQKPFHAFSQIGLRRFHDQMKMISHQTISVHLPASLGARLPKGKEKLLSILIIEENRFAPVPTAHHVITGACVLKAQRPGHRRQPNRRNRRLSIVSSDPFSFPFPFPPFPDPDPFSFFSPFFLIRSK